MADSTEYQSSGALNNTSSTQQDTSNNLYSSADNSREVSSRDRTLDTSADIPIENQANGAEYLTFKKNHYMQQKKTICRLYWIIAFLFF